MRIGECEKEFIAVSGKAEKHYNMRDRNVEYNVGDLVLLPSKNLSLKGVPTELQRKFVGPFEVTEVIGTQACKLNLPDSWKLQNACHVSSLKRWKAALHMSDEGSPIILGCRVHIRREAELERVLMRLRGGNRNRFTLPPFKCRFEPCQRQCSWFSA